LFASFEAGKDVTIHQAYRLMDFIDLLHSSGENDEIAMIESLPNYDLAVSIARSVIDANPVAPDPVPVSALIEIAPVREPINDPHYLAPSEIEKRNRLNNPFDASPVANESIYIEIRDIKKLARHLEPYLLIDFTNIRGGFSIASNNALFWNTKIFIDWACSLAHHAKMRFVAGSGKAMVKCSEFFRDKGFECYIENGQSRKEVNVDLNIAKKMMSLRNNPPGLLLFFSGDGNMNDRYSFPQIMIELLRAGWTIIVFAFKKTLSTRYIQLANYFTNNLKIVILDNVMKRINGGAVPEDTTINEENVYIPTNSNNDYHTPTGKTLDRLFKSYMTRFINNKEIQFKDALRIHSLYSSSKATLDDDGNMLRENYPVDDIIEGCNQIVSKSRLPSRYLIKQSHITDFIGDLPVSVIIDYSNIMHSFNRTGQHEINILDFLSWVDCLIRRPYRLKFLAGSSSDIDENMGRIKALRYSVYYENNSNDSHERVVDHRIALKLKNLSEAPDGILFFFSGDGNNKEIHPFPKLLQHLITIGWKVIVFSFPHSLSATYLKLIDQHGDNIKIFNLMYYHAIYSQSHPLRQNDDDSSDSSTDNPAKETPISNPSSEPIRRERKSKSEARSDPSTENPAKATNPRSGPIKARPEEVRRVLNDSDISPEEEAQIQQAINESLRIRR